MPGMTVGGRSSSTEGPCSCGSAFVSGCGFAADVTGIGCGRRSAVGSDARAGAGAVFSSVLVGRSGLSVRSAFSGFGASVRGATFSGSLRGGERPSRPGGERSSLLGGERSLRVGGERSSRVGVVGREERPGGKRSLAGALAGASSFLGSSLFGAEREGGIRSSLAGSRVLGASDFGASVFAGLLGGINDAGSKLSAAGAVVG